MIKAGIRFHKRDRLGHMGDLWEYRGGISTLGHIGGHGIHRSTRGKDGAKTWVYGRKGKYIVELGDIWKKAKTFL